MQCNDPGWGKWVFLTVVAVFAGTWCLVNTPSWDARQTRKEEENRRYTDENRLFLHWRQAVDWLEHDRSREDMRRESLRRQALKEMGEDR